MSRIRNGLTPIFYLVHFEVRKLQGYSRVLTRPAGRVTGCSKCHGLGPVGSRSVQNLTGRVGSGRVKEFSNIKGRVRPSQEVMKARGSGEVMTREKRVTRGSGQHDPRVFC